MTEITKCPPRPERPEPKRPPVKRTKRRAKPDPDDEGNALKGINEYILYFTDGAIVLFTMVLAVCLSYLLIAVWKLPREPRPPR